MSNKIAMELFDVQDDKNKSKKGENVEI